jgi:hypothetical protein
MVTTSFRNTNCMDPMRRLHMHSRGVIFFSLGTEEGKPGGCSWMELLTLSVLILLVECPCMIPMMFLNFPMCSPEHHAFIPHHTLSNTYHSNFAPSTLIILFSEMLKFSEFFLKEQNFVKENMESSGIFYLLK